MKLAISFAVTAMLWGCAAVAGPPVRTKPPGVSAPARDEVLTVQDVVDLRVASELALSPDGRRVAYVLRIPRKPAEKPGAAHRALFVVDVAGGGAPRQYTREPGSASAPEWAPDGRSIVYVGRREGDARAQLWRIPADGGEPERLTDAATSVRAFAWLSDGERIVFTADRELSGREREDRDAGRDWKVGDVDGTPRQLHLLELASGTTRPLSPRDFHVEMLRPSPRGDAVAVIGGTRADVDGTMMYGGVHRIAIGKGEPTAPQKLCEHEGKLADLAWSPDGATIAFLGAADLHDPTAGVVFTVPATGGTAKPLTLDYPGTAQRVRFTGNARLLVLANEDTRTSLLRVALPDGKRTRVLDRGPVCHTFDATADGGTIACLGDTAAHPAEVFVRKGGGALRRRSVSNPGLARKKLGEQSVVRWKASDGLEIAGVLTLPVDYAKGRRYPLVVLPHGGPEGVSLAGWNTRAGYPAQLFAARGYVVLEPNYRGSSGRGVAFGKADHADLGGREFDDVLAGIDELVARGLVDGDRVGMGGWSYGGYFSGLAATQHSKRFKAAMVGAAITNWMSFTGTTEIEHENSLVHWKLWPYDDPELVWKRSPMAHTKGSKTATLLVHGLDDSRVPPEQAKELYRALKHAGATTELVFYPREGHGLAERAHQLDFVQRFLDWFDKHLQPTHEG